MTTLFIIACGAEKVNAPTQAQDLYSSATFRHFLASAQVSAADHTDYFGEDARVMILSAAHGLVELDDVIAPYDLRMGQEGCVSPEGIAAQLAEIAPDTVTSLLPAAYNDALRAGIEISNDDEDNAWISLVEAFEDAPGIGFQRGVASSLIRTAA